MWKFFLQGNIFMGAESSILSKHLSTHSLHFVPSIKTLLCVIVYLSCAWSWTWCRIRSFGRYLCAVDHDSVRVWLCTSLQNKLYLFPFPVSRLLEGAPNPPTKALQEGSSGCGGGRQLCDGKRHNNRGHSYTDKTIIFSLYGNNLH